MTTPNLQADNGQLALARCQQGDPQALAELRGECQDALRNVLLARGATITETEDLLADLWADCVPGADDRPSLLERFSGRCAIQNWLATVLTNRWIDLKRREARRAALPVNEAADGSEPAPATLDQLAEETPAWKDDTVLQLLRDSLKHAFTQCPAQALVLLRLLHQHGLTQREVCRMLGWSESRLSRFLTCAREEIESCTLARVKMGDPWLQLNWKDFVSLCETGCLEFWFEARADSP